MEIIVCFIMVYFHAECIFVCEYAIWVRSIAHGYGPRWWLDV